MSCPEMGEFISRETENGARTCARGNERFEMGKWSSVLHGKLDNIGIEIERWLTQRVSRSQGFRFTFAILFFSIATRTVL